MDKFTQATPPDLSSLPPDAMLTRDQVAAVSGFALQTLKMWPAQGKGPKITTIEGRPRYKVADVREWMGLNTASPVSRKPPTSSELAARLTALSSPNRSEA